MPVAAPDRGGRAGDHGRRPDPLHAARGQRPAAGRRADALRRGRPRPRPAADRARPPHAQPPRPDLVPRRLASTRARRAREAALREAEEETGLDPAGVDVFAELPELWLPPSNFAVTPVLGWWETESPVGVVDPDEVHAVYRVPISELVGPDHRIRVAHPSGWVGPGYLIGADKDLVLWGFTAGIIARLFDFVGWADEVADAPVRVRCPPTCCKVNPPGDPKPNTRFGGGPVNLLDWLLVVLVARLRALRLLAGLHHRRVRDHRPAARRPVRRLARPVALGDADPSVLVSLGALFIVILCASLGQALLQFAGARLRDRITLAAGARRRRGRRRGAERGRRAARRVGARRRRLRLRHRRHHRAGPQLAGARRRSTRCCRPPPTTLLGAFNDVVGVGLLPPLPRALRPRADRRGPARAAAASLTDPDVEDAEASVLKIRGTNNCGRGVEGTGFVYADGRVMTNAHVVAGVADPEVEIGGDTVSRRGRPLRPRPRRRGARRRHHRPARRCPSTTPAEPRRRRGRSSATPRTARTTSRPAGSAPSSGSARPTSTARARVIREVFSLRGLVRPGNSGGPIVSSAGDVGGRGVRRLGHRRRHRLRADRRPGGAERGARRRAHRPGVDRRLRRLSRSGLALEGARDLRALLIAFSGPAHLLDLAHADEDRAGRRSAGRRRRR